MTDKTLPQSKQTKKQEQNSKQLLKLSRTTTLHSKAFSMQAYNSQRGHFAQRKEVTRVTSKKNNNVTAFFGYI